MPGSTEEEGRRAAARRRGRGAGRARCSRRRRGVPPRRVRDASTRPSPSAASATRKNFGDAAVGAQARFQRANDDNEVKGYTFEFKEFADDKNDPATALSEARRLVTQEGVNAIVPNVSLVTPSDFLTQSQIPWFGSGYDTTYCDAGRLGLQRLRVHHPGEPEGRPGHQLGAALQGAHDEEGHQEPDRRAARRPTPTRARRRCRARRPRPRAPASRSSTPRGRSRRRPRWSVTTHRTPQALPTANDGKAPDVVYTTIPATSSIALVNQIKTGGYTGTFLRRSTRRCCRRRSRARTSSCSSRASSRRRRASSRWRRTSRR